MTSGWILVCLIPLFVYLAAAVVAAGVLIDADVQQRIQSALRERAAGRESQDPITGELLPPYLSKADREKANLVLHFSYADIEQATSTGYFSLVNRLVQHVVRLAFFGASVGYLCFVLSDTGYFLTLVNVAGIAFLSAILAIIWQVTKMIVAKNSRDALSRVMRATKSYSRRQTVLLGLAMPDQHDERNTFADLSKRTGDIFGDAMKAQLRWKSAIGATRMVVRFGGSADQVRHAAESRTRSPSPAPAAEVEESQIAQVAGITEGGRDKEHNSPWWSPQTLPSLSTQLEKSQTAQVAGITEGSSEGQQLPWWPTRFGKYVRLS